MKHVAIITNIPAPYRVDFFDYLEKNIEDFRFTIIYSSENEDNRSWVIDSEKMQNSIFLESKTIKIKKKYDTKYIHVPWGVSKTLKKISPDVVVASEYNPTVIQALQYCKKEKIPFVSWTDGTLFSERNINLVQKFLRKYVIKNANSYIASSSKSKEAQLHYGAKEEKCHISLLTVDVEKYIQKSEEHKNGKIFCVSSLIQRKGIDLLIETLAKLTVDFSLFIAGNGDEKENLIKLAKEANIQEKVTFLGQLNRDELLKHYADSELFVLPTREDCFALVILEAICSGLPIICSKYADGAYDLIEEGKNGFIVDPYNTTDFASCIEMVLTNKDLQEKMRAESNEIIEKFKFKSVAQGYMDAITQSMLEK